MNRYKILVGSLIIFFIVFLPIVEAANNDSLLNPGMGMNWYRSQPQEFKNLVVWVFGATIFIVGAGYILFTLYGTTAAHYEGTFGSQGEKARHHNILFRNFAILILMIAIIIIALSLFGWF